MSEADPAIADDRASLIVLTRPECIALLERLPIGRVVFDDQGHPVALPVNYRWHDDAVVFRALEGTTLHEAVLEAPVGFEVDEWHATDHKGSSVLIKGRATEVTDWADRAQLEELNIVPWATGPWRQTWIRITPGEITGRRIA